MRSLLYRLKLRFEEGIVLLLLAKLILDMLWSRVVLRVGNFLLEEASDCFPVNVQNALRLSS
jgi:hypothetical protein